MRRSGECQYLKISGGRLTSERMRRRFLRAQGKTVMDGVLEATETKARASRKGYSQ